MNIDEVCYKVIGAAMAVHRLINFGAASLQHKHKYHVYIQQQPLNPLD